MSGDCINPRTENIALPDGLVMAVKIAEGVSKPYMDNSGAFWLKNGADKRKVTSREELQRMFQAAGLIHADETPVNGMTVADLDREYFEKFLKQRRESGGMPEDTDISLPQLLEALDVMKAGTLTIAGALLFAAKPQARLHAFMVTAVAFPETTTDGTAYLDSRNIEGKLEDMFRGSLSFVLENMRHSQGERSVNSLGAPEIPRIVFEELIANALVHRDYFVSDPIKLLMFPDRIEIISPGHLPNNLTVENIKRGVSNRRNPILASHAVWVLPYRGLGSGVSRALKAWPFIMFEDDRQGNRFKATVYTVKPTASAPICNVVLPFQKIEQVDEPRAEKERKLQPELFDLHTGRQLQGWTNKLIWGDNKLVLSSLKNGPMREEIDKQGGIKLIYIDPPFDIGADFSMDVEIGDDTFTKQPTVLEELAYRDTWGRGADSFIAMIYERLSLMRDLLAPDGVIYVHCDWRVSHHIRQVLDEVFGSNNFLNEIVWSYFSFKRKTAKKFPQKHDNIISYTPIVPRVALGIF